jgi:hypothetical protein
VMRGRRDDLRVLDAVDAHRHRVPVLVRPAGG